MPLNFTLVFALLSKLGLFGSYLLAGVIVMVPITIITVIVETIRKGYLKRMKKVIKKYSQ